MRSRTLPRAFHALCRVRFTHIAACVHAHCRVSSRTLPCAFTHLAPCVHAHCCVRLHAHSPCRSICCQALNGLQLRRRVRCISHTAESRYQGLRLPPLPTSAYAILGATSFEHTPIHGRFADSSLSHKRLCVGMCSLDGQSSQLEDRGSFGARMLWRRMMVTDVAAVGGDCFRRCMHARRGERMHAVRAMMCDKTERNAPYRWFDRGG